MRASTNANIIHMWNITKDCGRPSSLLKCYFFSCVSTFLGPLPFVIYFLITPQTSCYLYSILYSPSPLSQLVPLSYSFPWSIFLTFFPKPIKCWYILWASKRLELVCVVNNLYNAIWPRSYEVIIKHPISSILNILNKPSLHFPPVSKKKRKKNCVTCLLRTLSIYIPKLVLFNLLKISD